MASHNSKPEMGGNKDGDSKQNYFFQFPPGTVKEPSLPDIKEDVALQNDTGDDTCSLVSELERMAAKELQRKTNDENERHLWTLQSQLSLLWQRFMVDPEQVIKKKVDQVRSGGQRLTRRFSTGGVGNSSVNYCSAGQGVGRREETIGIYLEPQNLSDFLNDRVTSIAENEEETHGVAVGTKRPFNQNGSNDEVDSEEDETNETERMIKKK